MPIDYSVLGPQAKPGSPERKLVPLVQTSPEQDAIDAQTEASSWVGKQLDDEIARTDPKKEANKYALLQDEKAKRDGPTPSIDYSSLSDEATPQIDYSSLQPKSEGFRAYNRVKAAMDQTEQQTKENLPQNWRDRLAGASGVVAGLPIGVAEFAGSSIENVARLFQIPGLEHITVEDINKLMQQPTFAAEIHKQMEAKMPMFATGVNQVNSPIAAAFEGASGAVSQTVEGMGGSPAAGQLSEKALEIVLGVLGAKSAIKGMRGAKEAPTPASGELEALLKEHGQAADQAAPKDAPFTGIDAERAPETMQQDMLNPQEQWRTDENGMPYRSDVEPSAPVTRDIFSPENVDKVEADKETFKQETEAYQKRREDEAWDKHKAEQEAIQKAEFEDEKVRNTPLDDNYEPSQSSPQMEKITRPISNRGPLARQRGAVDVSFLDPRGWFDKGDLERNLRDISKVSTALFRKYGPDVDLGENRAGRYESIQQGKGQLPVPHLEVEKIGDKWTVVDHDGRHRSDVLLQAGEKDMPVRFKDDSGQFKYENPKEIRSQDMETMLPNPWYDKTVKTEGKGIYDGSPRYDGRTKDMKEADRATSDESFEELGKRLERESRAADNEARLHRAYIKESIAAKESPNEARPTYEEWKQKTGARSVLGGPGKKQGGALDISSLFKDKNEKADYDRARQIVGRDNRPVEQFVKDVPPPTQDVNNRFGAASGSWKTKREMSKNVENKEHAIHTLNYLLDNMHLLKEQTERLIVEKVHPAKMALMSNYRSRFNVTFKHNQLMKDMAIVKQFEKSPEAWRKSPEQWSPTKSQLKAAGLDERSANAWGQYYKTVEDVLWPQIEQFAQSKGIHAPDRIPAWLPHFTDGAWKVQMYKDTGRLDESGQPVIKRLATVGAKSRAGAQMIQAQLEKYSKGYEGEVKVRTLEPNTGGDVAQVLEGLFKARDEMNLNKGLAKLVEKAFEQASIGQLKNALERKADPQILHQLDRVITKDEFQLGREDARKALNKMTDVLEYIPTMNMRAKFLTDHFFPLQMAGYFDAKGMPNLSAAALEYTKQFLRISDTASAFLDNFVDSLFIRAGWDPKIGQHVVGNLQGAATAFYLMFRPAFWAIQQGQKIATQGLMWTNNAEMRMAGLKTNSIPVALAKSAVIPARWLKTASGESIKDYAEKTGASQPMYVENMRGNFLSDPIAKLIERQTRTAGVESSYLQLRSALPEQDALNGATRMTKEMNIDYTQELGKPTWFSKEGYWMRPVFMFMQYSLHQMQMLTYQASVLKHAVADRNLMAAKDALIGLSYNVAMMGVMGGMLGFPFAPQINSALKALNEEFGWQLPTAVSFARDIAAKLKEHNFKDDFANFAGRTAEFGLYSDTLGYNISGSARGPTLQSPNAFPHFIRLLVDMGVLTAKMNQSYGVSAKELNETAKEMPQSVRGSIIEYLSNGRDVGKTAEKMKDLVTGKQSEYAPMPSDPNLPGTYKRSQADSAMAAIGIKSIGEASTDDTRAEQEHRTKVMDEVNGRLIQQFKENPKDERMKPWLREMGKVYGDSPVNQGKDIGQVIDSIVNYQMERKLTEPQRMQLGLSSLRSFSDWKRWGEEMKREVVKK